MWDATSSLIFPLLILVEVHIPFICIRNLTYYFHVHRAIDDLRIRYVIPSQVTMFYLRLQDRDQFF